MDNYEHFCNWFFPFRKQVIGHVFHCHIWLLGYLAKSRTHDWDDECIIFTTWSSNNVMYILGQPTNICDQLKYIYINQVTCVHQHVFTNMCSPICIRMCMYVCIYICMYVYIYIYARNKQTNNWCFLKLDMSEIRGFTLKRCPVKNRCNIIFSNYVQKHPVLKKTIMPWPIQFTTIWRGLAWANLDLHERWFHSFEVLHC